MPFIDAAMAPILAAMRERDAARGDAPAGGLEDLRREVEAEMSRWNGAPDDVEFSPHESLPGSLWCRAKASDASGIVVWLHGGGFILGSPRTHAGIAASLARRTGARILLPAYPLAPQTRLPQQIAWVTEVLASLAACHPSTPLCVGGDSAGAYLALASLARLGASHGYRALVLAYPTAGGPRDTASAREFAQGFGLTRAMSDLFWQLAQGGEGGVELDLLHADLSAAPATLLTCAGLDILRDDAFDLARALLASGVQTRLQAVPGVVHAFLHMEPALPAAAQALADISDFFGLAMRRE